MITITYHTTSAGEWSGIGMDLTAAQVDRNFYNVAVKLQELEDSRPQPNEIANFLVDGATMTVVMEDATQYGPLPLPVLQFHWRNAYLGNMVYDPLDTFMVEGVGIYSTIIGHLTPLTFNENLEVDGDPVYNKLFGADAGSAAVAILYDMGFFYQGILADSTADTDRLWELPMVREVTLANDGSHQAYLQTAPSTEDQICPIYIDDVVVGSVTFIVDSNLGVVDIAIPGNIGIGIRFGVGKPPATDPAAAGLSVVFATTRTI